MRLSPNRSLRWIPLLAVTLLLPACVPEPVDWAATTDRGEGALPDTLRLVLDSALAPAFVAAFTPPTWPVDGAACVISRRAARAANGDTYASWFAVRPDSSVRLYVARSDDGGATWNAAVPADTTDVGVAGCARPVPFISVDDVNGYVHLAYHLDAREGAGIFFAHSMDRGGMFHAPVPIVYGDRPSRAAVASHGDTVVVVYEDPNSRIPRLGLALSRTQGHIFEARQPAVSDESGEARAPQAAVQDGKLVVVWTASQRDGAWPRTVLRQGRLTF